MGFSAYLQLQVQTLGTENCPAVDLMLDKQ